jgi:NAD(P)-dependent dehydrogenase (short-subunit alcohol dehydrogenase family)
VEGFKPAAVVIGGTGGIGVPLVRSFLERGRNVLFSYFEHHELASALEHYGQELDTQCRAVQIDLRSPSSPSIVSSTLRSLQWSPETLVNIAGFNKRVMFEDLTFEDWDDAFRVNVTGPIAICSALGSLMWHQRRGAIVNVGSTAEIRPLARSPQYVASKAALSSLSLFMARTFAPWVVVNTVLPGLIDTPNRRSDRPLDPGLVGHIPLGRFGATDDIVRVIEMLANPGIYLTGQSIIVDGGYSL